LVLKKKSSIKALFLAIKLKALFNLLSKAFFLIRFDFVFSPTISFDYFLVTNLSLEY